MTQKLLLTPAEGFPVVQIGRLKKAPIVGIETWFRKQTQKET